jgi:hypothetical protein
MKPFVISTMAVTLLSGCAVSVGPTGPAGPPGVAGPPGPAGPANRAPQRLAVLRATTSMAVPDDIDVVLSQGTNVITLPAATAAGPGRTITVRAQGGATRIVVAAGDRIDAADNIILDADEMATVISDGGNRWTIISASDL